MYPKIRYYKRLDGTYVRVINDIKLECLTDDGIWEKNQEWFVSMFVDGEDQYKEVDEHEVIKYYNELQASRSFSKIKK